MNTEELQPIDIKGPVELAEQAWNNACARLMATVLKVNSTMQVPTNDAPWAIKFQFLIGEIGRLQMQIASVKGANVIVMTQIQALTAQFTEDQKIAFCEACTKTIDDNRKSIEKQAEERDKRLAVPVKPGIIMPAGN